MKEEECIVLSSLKGIPGPVAPAYGFERKVEKTTNKLLLSALAHGQLQRPETQARKFIDVQMGTVFGEDWFKNRIIGKILQT